VRHKCARPVSEEFGSVRHRTGTFFCGGPGSEIMQPDESVIKISCGKQLSYIRPRSRTRRVNVLAMGSCGHLSKIHPEKYFKAEVSPWTPLPFM